MHLSSPQKNRNSCQLQTQDNPLSSNPWSWTAMPRWRTDWHPWKQNSSTNPHSDRQAWTCKCSVQSCWSACHHCKWDSKNKQKTKQEWPKCPQTWNFARARKHCSQKIFLRLWRNLWNSSKLGCGSKSIESFPKNTFFFIRTQFIRTSASTLGIS